MQYQTYPLRLPPSLRVEVDKMARQKKLSVNQFMLMAAVEKLTALGMDYDLKAVQACGAITETSKAQGQTKRGYTKWKAVKTMKTENNF